MDILEKLRIMLPHWVAHNRSHGKEFSEWAEQTAETNVDISTQLKKAVTALDDAQQALETALTMAGGKMSEHHPKHDHEHGHYHHH